MESFKNNKLHVNIALLIYLETFFSIEEFLKYNYDGIIVLSKLIYKTIRTFSHIVCTRFMKRLSENINFENKLE